MPNKRGIAILLLLLWFVPGGPAAISAPLARRPPPPSVRTHYRLNLSWRDAATAYGKKELISNRGRAEGEWKVDFNPWLQAVGSGRLTFETAYSQNSNQYADTLRANPFYEVTLRDTYLSLKKGGTALRAGYQTVVWGEAFGNFYTDILNPKDFRELWLNELPEHEISVPMLNARFAGSLYSLQLIYLPRPSFNRNPAPDSPYAPRWSQAPLIPPGTLLGIRTDPAPDWFRTNEFAGRFTVQIGTLDLSIFGFTGLDRTPYYRVDSAAPASVQLGEQHSRIRAQGLTASTEWMGSVFRFESVLVSDRRLNRVTTLGIDEVTTDNVISVLGYDLPRGRNWSLGVQGSSDLLLKDSDSYWFRETHRMTIGTRLWWEFSGENSFELLASCMLPTPGGLIQPRFTHPLSRALELRWGGDLFLGKEGSEYERFRGASRVWIRLTGYFNG